MTIRISTVAFACMCVITACGSSSTGPSGSQGADQFYPLVIGNTWNLSLEGFTYLDTLSQTLDIDGDIDWTIEGDTTHAQGFQLFNWQETSILEYSFSGFPIYSDTLSFVNYVAEVDSVIRAYTSPSSTIFRVWMKYPVNAGDWWYSDPEFPSRIMTVISLDSSVTVPAGTFSCLYIQQTEPDFPDSYVDFFYASGVGPVKYTVHIEELQNIYHTVAEMVEYSVQ